MSKLRDPIGNCLSFVAGGTLTEGGPVKFDANAAVVASTGNTDDCCGISQAAAVAGEIVEIAIAGCITDAIAGGVLTAGTHGRLMPGAAGLIAATTGNKACAFWLPNANQTSAISTNTIRVIMTAPIELP